MALNLPPIAPVPPGSVRFGLHAKEWQVCIDAWLVLTDYFLRLPSASFASISASSGHLSPFLTSFYHEVTHAPDDEEFLSNDHDRPLKKKCFLLVNRLVREAKACPHTLLDLKFLSDFSRAHAHSTTALLLLMTELWQKQRQTLEANLTRVKKSLITSLESKDPSAAHNDLRLLAPLLRASTDIATVFITGSDFLVALNTGYDHSTMTETRKSTTSTAYRCLASLLDSNSPSISILSDHLYLLGASVDRHDKVPSLLADLVTNTPLLNRLRKFLQAQSSERLAKLLAILETFRTPSIRRIKSRPRPVALKNKGKAPLRDEGLNMHSISLVSQIHDLFPDLGTGFVLKLLDEYNDDVEQVTAHLLDETLPQHWSELNRTEEGPHLAAEKADLTPKPPSQIPQISLPERRNIFDGDELYNLELGTSRLHLGKEFRHDTENQQPNKAAILSALAAFDSDDDERDDTYDVEDVGGTVDQTQADGDPQPGAKALLEENEVVLYTAYKSSPQLFGRTWDIRRGQARAALKSDTGMTDEAIEGWAIMLQRDPGRRRKLEGRIGAAFDGKQMALANTSYREGAFETATETEDSDVAERGPHRGITRGGGRGRGRGGSVAGPANDPETATAQRRKEANKGGRANHNRRNQRAKKMARGGFSG